MIYRLSAPFKKGTAGTMKIINGIGTTDNKQLVDELTNPQSPHGFKLLETIDEVAAALAANEQGKTGDSDKE